MHGVDIERTGPVAVVRASGELDAFAAPDLEAAFAEVVAEGRVLVDLERVSFMDSTALGLLARRVRELHVANARVRVVLPLGTARRIFEMTTLDAALPVVADRDAGLEELEAAT